MTYYLTLFLHKKKRSLTPVALWSDRQIHEERQMIDVSSIFGWLVSSHRVSVFEANNETVCSRPRFIIKQRHNLSCNKRLCSPTGNTKSGGRSEVTEGAGRSHLGNSAHCGHYWYNMHKIHLMLYHTLQRKNVQSTRLLQVLCPFYFEIQFLNLD